MPMAVRRLSESSHFTKIIAYTDGVIKKSVSIKQRVFRFRSQLFLCAHSEVIFNIHSNCRYLDSPNPNR